MLLNSLCLTLAALSAPLNAEMTQLNTDHTQFAFSLYPAVASDDDNVVFSPYSISTCLSMVYLGARGDTESQMQKALHLEVDRKNIARASLSLAKSLSPANDKGYKLHTANALWIDQGTFLLTDYRYAIEEQFKAKLGKINFANPTNAVSTINDWISAQTQNKITNLLSTSDINELTRLVLTNAVYFEGAWATPFDPQLTHDWPFHPTTETSANVQMMSQTLNLSYYENDLVQLATLPFQGTSNGGGGLGLVLLLPKSAENFDKMTDELSDEFNHWLSSTTQKKVELKLPKFDVNTHLDLKNPLEHLGMEDAFDSSANFIGIDGLRDLFLNKVIHQAFFTLDENGVVAAAATAASMGLRGAPDTAPPLSLIADHPFLFFIVDLNSLEMLFMGKVVNPVK